MRLIKFKLLFCLVMVLNICCKVKCGTKIDIYREERDTFTNIAGCATAKADCFAVKVCTYCRCAAHHTFLQTRGERGECVPNELLVPATSREDSFLLQNIPSSDNQYCIRRIRKRDWGYTFVLGKSGCSKEHANISWILTKSGQLLNWESLQCLTDDEHGLNTKVHFVMMRKCDRHNSRQLWECKGDDNYNIKQSQSSRYLHDEGQDWYLKTKYTLYPQGWKRFGSGEDICSQVVGCETFTNGSSLLVLHKQNCEDNSECLGRREIVLNRRQCSLLPQKTQYLHNDTWKAMQMETEGLAIVSSYNKVFLEWDLNKTPKSWQGLLIKVRFQCANGASTYAYTTKDTHSEHCVVVKYSGLFTVTLPRKDDDDDDNDERHSLVENGKKGDDVDDKVEDDQEKSESSGKDLTKMIVIVVCSLVGFCFAGGIGILVRGYKIRSARSEHHNREITATNPDISPAISSEDSVKFTNHLNSHYALPVLDYDRPNGNVDDRAFVVRLQSPEYERPISHKYEYPENWQGHQYEYPSLGYEHVNATEKTEDSGYTPLMRLPWNKYESQNGGYTSLIEGEGTVDQGKEAIGTEVNTNGMQYVGVTDGRYTPLARRPLKAAETEVPRYQPLMKDWSTSEENVDIEKKDEAADGLPYVEVIDNDYTPLARRPSKADESEGPRYQPLINDRNASEEAGARGKKDEADGLPYVEVIDNDYTPLARQPLKDFETEDQLYQALIKDQEGSKEIGATGKIEEDGLSYVDVIGDDYTPLTRQPLEDFKTEAPRYQPLIK